MLRTLLLTTFVLAGFAHADLLDPTEHGPYPVGHTAMILDRPDPDNPGATYPLDTLVWYPAVAGTGSPFGTVLLDATVATRRFPVVAFSHGFCGGPGQSQFLYETLASHGIIVAAPPHPGTTFADCFSPSGPDSARSFANRPGEIIFAIDELIRLSNVSTSRFFRHVNRRRLGVSGHSFGGQTALRVAALDPRIRATAALAPALPPDPLTITAAGLVITGEIDSLTPFLTEAVPAYEMLAGPRYLVKMVGAGHCVFIPGCIPSFCGVGCDPPAMGTVEGNELALRYAVPFLLDYVAGKRKYGTMLLPENAPANVQVLQAHRR